MPGPEVNLPIDDLDYLRDLVENVNDLVQSVRPDGTFVYVNHAWCKTLGYSREEVAGLSVFDVIHPCSRAHCQEVFERALAGEQFDSVESTFIAKDGRAVVVEASVNCRYQNDRPVSTRTILRDITERKRIAAALQESEHRSKLIFDAALDAIVVMDCNNTIKSWNPQAEATFGWSREEAIGRSLAETIIPPHLRSAHHLGLKNYLEKAVGRMVNRRVEIVGLHRDGHEFPVELAITPFPCGASVLFAGFLRDISDRQRAEELLRTNAEHFRALVEMSSDAILLGDRTAQILYASPSIERILGYSADDLGGQAGLDLIHPDDVDVARNVLQRTNAAPGEHVGFLLRARNKEGAWRWLDGVCTNHLEEPAVRAIVVNLRDVTQNRQAEERLAESERSFRSLLNSAPIPILVQRDQRLIYVNKELVKLLGGTSAADFLGKPIWSIVHADDHAAVRERVGQLGRDEVVPLLEEKYVRLDGTSVDVEVTAARCAFGGMPAVQVLARDITERKRAEEERRRLEAQIQHAQKLESLGILAGGIAHDFNNLLTTVLGYTDLALAELLPDSRARELIEEAMNGARKAAELTTQMLAYSGKGVFVVRTLDLSQIVTDMIRLLEISISKKCALKFTFMPDLPAIEGDAAQMRQVIMNLVINASEAIGDASGVISVTTGVMHCDRAYLSESYLDENLQAGHYVYLEVADTGCGMSDETKANVFDPFFTTKFMGRGLGLAAVLGIVRGHRGAIKVISELGKGTTFRVLIPASKQHAVSADKPVPAPVGEWRGSGTVLIVDDEETMRRLARTMLEKMGFDVLVAPDGRAGVETFRTQAEQIQLVLLDMTMPQMDGAEAFDAMQQIRSDVRVILSSGYNEQTTTGQFAGKGLAGFIQKPYTTDELKAVVRKVMAEEGS